MKHLVLSVLFLAFVAAYAEYITKPDDNTLWLENGQNNMKGWKTEIKITPVEGGFTIAPGEKRHDGGRYVPNDPAYPWFVGEITGIEHLEGYRDINFNQYFHMVANPMTGIFAVKRIVNTPQSFLRIDVYGLIVTMKYLKQVKKPDYYIDTKKVDEGIEVTVYLKDIAEDVCISYYDSYCMPALQFDNQNKLQLLPTDEENPLVWKGIIKNCHYNGKGKLLLKASILGGKLKTPLWGVVDKALLK